MVQFNKERTLPSKDMMYDSDVLTHKDTHKDLSYSVW